MHVRNVTKRWSRVGRIEGSSRNVELVGSWGVATFGIRTRLPKNKLDPQSNLKGWSCLVAKASNQLKEFPEENCQSWV